MTRATTNSLINHANAAIRAGDCQEAQQALGQAWLALGEYSAALAARGVSPAAAVSLHRSISKALVAAGKRCGVRDDGSGLMPPSGRTTGTNPDLLRPSFSGPGDQIFNSLTTTLTTLGIIGAAGGLAYGLWTVYKA